MSAVARLAFDCLVAGYGSAPVVRGVSGTVAGGEVLCIIGRNGVGKSTLLKMLVGYLRLWQGSVLLDGRSIDALEPSDRRAAGISYCPQERPVFDDLSVRDNLTLMRAERTLDAFDSLFQRFPILSRRQSQLAGTLSGGEKKILSFVRGLSERQALTVLDEPSEGVQWENTLQMQAVIEQRRQEGASFIVVEQNLAFAERIADCYLAIDQGRVTLTARAANVSRNDLLAHLHV